MTDPSDAVIVGPGVAVSKNATGQKINVTTNSGGIYNSGALIPGDYTVQVSAKGFSTVGVPITVLVANTASGDARLPLGAESEVIQPVIQ